MATLSNAIPKGSSPPLLKLDDNHHGSWLVISSAFGLVIILLTLIIRIYLRYRVSPPFAADDIALTVSTALAVVQCALVFAGVHHGDGTSIDLIEPDKLVPIQQLNYAANIFYVVTLYASKVCVVLLFKRISSGIVHKRIALVALGITLTLGFISVLLSALRCDLSEPWIQFGDAGVAKCGSLFAQWKAIIALDIATEVGLFVMAVHLVWGLQAAVPTKLRVIFAFGLRLPVIALAALQIHYLAFKLSSTNEPLAGVPTTLIRQTEIFYAIMASTIPCLRPFLASFFTGFGAMGGDTVIAGSQIGNSGSNSNPNSNSNSNTREKYALSSMQSSSGSGGAAVPVRSRETVKEREKRRSRMRDSGRGLDNFGIERQNRAHVSHDTTGSSSRNTAGTGTTGAAGLDAVSIASNESTKMIITKEVQWCVDSERGSMVREL